MKFWLIRLTGSFFATLITYLAGWGGWLLWIGSNHDGIPQGVFIGVNLLICSLMVPLLGLIWYIAWEMLPEDFG